MLILRIVTVFSLVKNLNYRLRKVIKGLIAKKRNKAKIKVGEINQTIPNLDQEKVVTQNKNQTQLARISNLRQNNLIFIQNEQNNNSMTDIKQRARKVLCLEKLIQLNK